MGNAVRTKDVANAGMGRHKDPTGAALMRASIGSSFARSRWFRRLAVIFRLRDHEVFE